MYNIIYILSNTFVCDRSDFESGKNKIIIIIIIIIIITSLDYPSAVCNTQHVRKYIFKIKRCVWFSLIRHISKFSVVLKEESSTVYYVCERRLQFYRPISLSVCLNFNKRYTVYSRI